MQTASSCAINLSTRTHSKLKYYKNTHAHEAELATEMGASGDCADMHGASPCGGGGIWVDAMVKLDGLWASWAALMALIVFLVSC